ncbi:plasmid replication DNA-binding protein [Acinetobacter baumannii]
MKKLTVSELAKLYGYSRQAIYAHINKGNLSKGSDGLIDFTEALRVFGEPQNKGVNVNQSQSIDTPKLTEVDLLKRQVDILEKQLNQALLRENQSIERESFYQEQIEAMQRLLEAPKAHSPTSIDPNTPASESVPEEKSAEEITSRAQEESEVKHDGLITPEQTENKRIPVPEHVEQEPEKRGFWSRFFRPYD